MSIGRYGYIDRNKKKGGEENDNNTGKSERGGWEDHYGSEPCWVSGGEKKEGIAN